MNPPPLAAGLGTLKGVGPKLASRLGDLGLSTVEDLLFHFPLRYQDRTQITPIGALVDGIEALVAGTVRLSSVVPGRRRQLVVKVEDTTGLITLRFFHFRQAQAQQMRPGTNITLFGQARRGPGGVEMVHPEYRLNDSAEAVEQQLTPIYPTTEGLGQGTWRNLTEQALAQLRASPPEDLLAEESPRGFSLADAIAFLHRPPAGAPVDTIREGNHPAQQRLAIEEMIAHQLSLRELRGRERAHRACEISDTGRLADALLGNLPFEPTGAQRRVQAEILADMAQPTPMLRLVQGDVGSGKTLVAALTALAAIEAGFQVALMAPTELLAEQHRQAFQQWFEPLGIVSAALTGKMARALRRETLEGIASGTVQLVIGTHALFQDSVTFNRLALVIVDEQHRFGVHQRLALTLKSADDTVPHQLVMTATPIPRTLSMLAYADLDCSIIDELPPGRTPVVTSLIDSERRDQVIERVGKACRDGRQAYWVCTLIEDSEALDARPAEVILALLQERLPDVRVGLVHGRLTSSEKEGVMQAFKRGDLDLLVATTVIEVGVDVPNASLMIIENPERLGLAQLHQLRGRVGRGDKDSYCLLLYQGPLSQQGKARLNVMRESSDGFFIAEADLRLRGPGEVLGTRQTGVMAFRVARLPEHEHLLEQAAQIAGEIESSEPARAQGLIARWTGERAAFARV